MKHGFDVDGFMEWLKEKFAGCLDNYWDFELVENIINYGFKHEMIGKDQLAYWISDMLPEVEFLDVARFMEDGHLTNTTLGILGRIKRE